MKCFLCVVLVLGLSVNYSVHAAGQKNDAHAASKNEKEKKSDSSNKPKQPKKTDKSKIEPAKKPEHYQKDLHNEQSNNPEVSKYPEPAASPAQSIEPSDASASPVQADSPEPTPEPKKSTRSGMNLVIKKATYGSADKVCDATEAVHSLCESQESQCIVGAGNGLCGDSAPGVLKELRVTYTCSNHKQEPRSVSIPENTQSQLVCD